MRASVRNWWLAASLILPPLSPVSAIEGAYLPQAPGGTGGEDTIETASGTRCRQSMNSNGAYVDFGVVGNASSPVDPASRGFVSGDSRDREALAYARITMPLGKKPNRIDCSRIYELELARLKREIELLKMNTE